ncbi:MAG: glycosyltransferase [Desulfovibrio sp.]|jgi:glycosyltransferase involved in cell wall biosynthesis|nr:glycosyltransferase [Desulfovibrio sp.]
MKILFIHQNFPGQYLNLVQRLIREGGHSITGIGEDVNIKRRGLINGCSTIGYPSPDKAGAHTHHYLQNLEAAVRRGQSVAKILLRLKAQGFIPDVISLHPGWGEGLFAREVFPSTPLLMFCEYYFRAGEADLNFDPEFPVSLDGNLSIGLRNTAQVMSLLNADACISPTPWQASRYPEFIRNKIRIIHDGINVDYMTPYTEEILYLQPLEKAGHSRVLGWSAAGAKCRYQENQGEIMEDASGTIMPAPLGALRLTRRDKVITYATRNIEPYRGAHVFLRALPALLKLHPDAHILIAGREGVSYSRPLPAGQTYKDIYLREIANRVDLSRIHFLDGVPYPALRAIFRISAAHVYLTYPFVLSWSCLEAMSCEALLIASHTAPVLEAVKHMDTGLLVDFFDEKGLIRTLDEVLREPEHFAALRKRARVFVTRAHGLEKCLREQIDFLKEVAAKGS